MNTAIQYAQVIEREFRKAAALPVEARVSVEIDDEAGEVRVTADGIVWTHLDGAEDEDGNALFMFEDGSGAMIDFEAPADLPEL